MVNVIAFSPSTNVNVLNGSSSAVYLPLAAADSDAASFAWSNAGCFVAASGSTSTNSWPPFTDLR
jgi:hypothetical protein